MKDIETFAHGFSPRIDLIMRDENLVEDAHRLGITVSAWTVRDD